jgi:hypothetical protein
MKSFTNEFVEQAKTEILEDIIAGIVPATVTTFAELHDYVDANEYVENVPWGTGLPRDESDPAGVRLIIAVQDKVSEWLATPVAKRQETAS